MKIHSSLLFTSSARATSRAKKATLLLFSVAVLLAGGAAAVRGQSALDGFDPNAADGPVFAVAVQPDGKILVGGNFTMLGGTPHNRIGRLNVDGTVDTTFSNTAGADNGIVRAIAVQANGQIIVAGSFTTLNGGNVCNDIGRLNANGTFDASFSAGANNEVDSVVVQTNGTIQTILVGGAFTTIGGALRNRIARLSPNGAVDTTFNPGTGADDGQIVSVAVQADGKVLAGGYFTSFNGSTHNYIVRLNANGTLDSGFVDPAANSFMNTIALQADGKIVVGGGFTLFGTTTGRNHIARLNTNGTLDPAFDPNATGTVGHCRFNRGAGGRQDFSGRLVHQHRRTAAQPHRPAVHGRDARYCFRPEREPSSLYNRGAGGRQDFSGRLVHQHRRTAAQPHRPAVHGRDARPDAQSQHRRRSSRCNRRSAGRQDSHRRLVYQRF